MASQKHSKSLILSGLGLANYLLFYAVNVVLTRNVPADQVDDYFLAVSTVMVLSTLTTLGLEKYALRAVAGYRERGDPSRARGYRLFARRATAIGSTVIAALLITGLASGLITPRAQSHVPGVIALLFLPVISVCLLLVEIVTVNGSPLRAVTIYRLVLPASLLFLLLGVRQSPLSLTTLSALVCFGLAWSLALLLMYRAVRGTDPDDQSHDPVFEPQSWIKSSTPFLLHSLLLTLLGNTGVIVLAAVDPEGSQVSIFAISMQTGMLIVILATSTNRYFMPQISVLLERKDGAGMLRAARERLRLIGILAALFLGAILLFGKTILASFGPRYAEAYAVLIWIAAGGVVSTLFSLAPTYLQYTGRQPLVLSATALTVVANAVLCAILGRRWGALGAAVAYAVPVSVLYITLRVVALRSVRRLGEARGV